MCQFYQFWLNATDADAEKWIRIFTFLGRQEVEQLTLAHSEDRGRRLLQKKLAEEVTRLVHGQEELLKAIETTQKLFANQTAPAESLSVEDLEGMEGVVKSAFDRGKIAGGIDIVSFLSETAIFPSKGEARKTVQGGGVSINRKKVDTEKLLVEVSMLLHDKYILVQKGKKNYYLVEVK